MLKNKKNRKYTKEEVKEIFQSYIEQGDMYITEHEYDILCEAISSIPKEIVDKIKKEVYFVVLSREKDNKEWPACYTNLESKSLKYKKGIIFYSPLIFFPKDEEILYPIYPILHEIAHHELNHRDTENLEERIKQEKEAKELVLKWLSD